MLSDTDLLRIVSDEKKQSIGFDLDPELSADREKALNYYKGEMPDAKALPNRSKAVSTDVSDAVETVMPDLVEIFTGGDDVATFAPVGEGDEEAARQETDLVNWVVFQQNDGFMVLNTMFKDALLTKVGVVKWWWDAGKSKAVEEPLDLTDLADIPQEQFESLGVTAKEDGTYVRVTKQQVEPERVCLEAVPPDDFTVARDTVRLSKATYCAMRSRPRAQSLIADGYDPDLVAKLPAHASTNQSTENQARDTADESEDFRSSASTDGLRTVEIVEHYVRLADDDGSLKIWRVVTGGDETVLLAKEEVDCIPFAAITPYVVAHRFYGRSVADLTIQIQQLKTALLRMLLDGGYFALNQRLTVNMTGANEFTIPDLLRNEPGIPIRTKGEGVVQPVQSGGLGFDVLAALEQVSVMGEQRTGIVRNAQGLKPDTLHDTASGAMALMTNAQKRVRLIARVFAETGVKDLFLGVHACLRKYATQPVQAKLGGGWTQADPRSFAERKDMTVEVGVGSGGKEHAMLVGQQLAVLMQQVAAAPGGPQMITPAQVYNAAKFNVERGLGLKSVDPYIQDPAKAPPQETPPPPPDPKLVEVQQKGQLEREKMQLDAQLKREQMAAEIELKREQMQFEAKLKLLQGPAMTPVHMGGEPG